MTPNMRTLVLLLALFLVACSGDDGAPDSDGSGSDASTDNGGPDTPPNDISLPDTGDTADIAPPVVTECTSLDPVAHTEPIQTVGDGTPASCTGAALQTAMDAVNAARGGTVVFDCGGQHTVVLDQPIMIDTGGSDDGADSPVVLDGEGQITLSGNQATRILDLNHYTQLVVQRMTLRDGFVAQEPDTEDPPDSGAAIRHPWYGTLTAIDVRFENNHCESRNGEIGGGAVFAGGLDSAVFSGCTFVNNSASNGGGLHNRGSTLTIINSVFRNNGALSVGDGQFGNGGGVYIDGMNYDDPGDLYVCGGIFEQNTATQHGSGMFAYFYEGSASLIEHSVFDGNMFANPNSGSGGLYHQAVHMTLRNTTLANHVGGEHAGGLFVGSGSSADIENCTFANNEVPGNGAGIFNGASTVTITNSTFTNNKADYGPAIFKGQNASMTLTNTLMVANTTDNQFSATSCHDALTDGGGNIQWPETKASGNPDQPCVEGILFADPLLQPLADNGGVGQTAALGVGSPAIDYGQGCPETDQRGMPRVGACDSGAYEVQ